MNETAVGQDKVFGFLADPATHGGAKVERIDTHAASVFLAGERALKVKRAVRFPFLDYSTLEKRRHACAAELAVNAPYAPDIYRAVVPITREGSGKLAIGGAGPAVEWAVEMRRFDEKRTLDHLTSEISADLADALGRAVAAAHAREPATLPTVAAETWIAALGAIIEEHLAVFRAGPEIFPAAENEALAKDSRSAYARIVPLLGERAREGFIRRIHGDLHLGNIVLIDDRPVLFDAIEFSDVIATGDLFYDLAFLLMDLLERGLKPQANIVLNRYLAERRRSEDLDALATLPLFLSLRAAIRAKVTAARLERVQSAGRTAIARAARAYFEFARAAIAPPARRFVAVGGLSGTGKSALARALAPDLDPLPGAAILRSDVERKALFGTGETESLPAPAYAADVTIRVYATLADKTRRILAAGHSVIVDAVFGQPQERAALTEVEKASGVRLTALFLTAALQTRLARVGARTRDASDADAAVARAQEHYDLGILDWTEIDASGSPADTLARARAVLRQGVAPTK